MAEIVAGFLIPHDPLMTARPDAPPEAKAKSAWTAFDKIVERLVELEVDTIITIGDDHYGIFGPHCIPQCLICTGDIEGPMETWLAIERQSLPNHEELAQHILAEGHAEGIAWSFAKSIVVDHATMVPHHLCFSRIPGVRIIPIYLNAGVSPYIPNETAKAIGHSIRNAVSCWPGSEQVAIFGTGGCSHWVGTADMGKVNEGFDRRLIDMIAEGDIDTLIALSDAEIEETAGNGAVELKNWICAMAAMPGAQGDLLAYEAVPEWVSGIAFTELREPGV